MSEQRILVVEDDKLILKMLCSRLETEGYKVFGVSNASDALAVLHNEQPNLMILDLNLSLEPVFGGISDGYGLLYWFRSSPGGGLPVIIYTSDTMPNIERRAGEIPVSAIINKAEPISNLLSAIRKVLVEYENHAMTEQAPGPSATL